MKLRTKVLTGIPVAAMVVASIYVAGWLGGSAGQDLRLLHEVQAAGARLLTRQAPHRTAMSTIPAPRSWQRMRSESSCAVPACRRRGMGRRRRASW